MRARLLAVACLVLPALAGCTGSPDPPAAPEPDRGTPLTQVETTSLTVARGPWCAQLTQSSVEQALGTAVAESSQHLSGDRVRIAPGVRDVVHEDGCAFTGEDGTVARTWVFAPPVTPARARQLARAAAATQGCTPLPDAAAFGSPSVGLLCEGDGAVEASYRGLFGDAWLVCTLAVPRSGIDDEVADGLPDRTSRWCAGVVTAGSATP